MEPYIAGALLLALLAYNIRATLVVWRADDFERHQQIGQTAFIWLVPVIGALVVMNVLKPDTKVYRGGDESDG